jgi:glycosyltransferase involved in cell wall biosynthesis
MKIAVISTPTGIRWGGSEELWATMVDSGLNENLQLAVSICFEATIPLKFLNITERNLVRVFRRRHLFRPRVEKLVSKISSSFREVFRWKPDVICVNQGSAYEFLQFSDLLDLLYRAGVPYVVVCQYNDNRVLPEQVRNLAEEFFKRATRMVFVAQQNLSSVERQLARKLPNAVVLQNPVNLLDLTPLDWPGPRPISMASVARLAAKYKGQDILFEVLGSPIWRSREWRLRLYGAGEDREYLQALAQHYGITENIEFCGHVNDVRSVWKANHLLVLPSRAEGTPLALVEAMLCCRPAVVTDVGGNVEWITDGQTGYVAEAATANSLGVALERAWLHQANWQEMGIRARNDAFAKFDKSAGKTLLNLVLEAAYLPQANGLTASRVPHRPPQPLNLS